MPLIVEDPSALEKSPSGWPLVTGAVMSDHLTEQLEAVPLRASLAVFRKIDVIVSDAIKKGELPSERSPLKDFLTILSGLWISEGDEIVAFITLYEARPGVMWIDSVYTIDRYRRQRLADRLMTAARREMLKLGYSRAELGTKPHNVAMQSLARRHGMEIYMLGMGANL